MCAKSRDTFTYGIFAGVVQFDHLNVRIFLRRNDQVRLAHNHGLTL